MVGRVGTSRRSGAGSAPSPAAPPADSALLRACAAGWAGLTCAAYSPTGARLLINDAFGLDSSNFEDSIREPAAGLLELTSALFPLEAALLLVLSTTLVATAENRARIGGALALTSGGVIGTLGLALASGGEVASAAAVGGFATLNAGTAAAGLRAFSGCDPLGLFVADARELVSGGGAPSAPPARIAPRRAAAAAPPSPVASFYRGSAVLSLLVGLSFFASPVSPIALFDAEGPITHMARQDVGVYLLALVCPVQASLYRAAAATPSTLGEPSTRALNGLASLVFLLLTLDGKAQVEAGTEALAALAADSPIRALIDTVGDASRPTANTTAAFSVGFVVALVYLYQAATTKAAAPE